MTEIAEFLKFIEPKALTFSEFVYNIQIFFPDQQWEELGIFLGFMDRK